MEFLNKNPNVKEDQEDSSEKKAVKDDDDF
jgi:hypothetical protein